MHGINPRNSAFAGPVAPGSNSPILPQSQVREIIRGHNSSASPDVQIPRPPERRGDGIGLQGESVARSDISAWSDLSSANQTAGFQSDYGPQAEQFPFDRGSGASDVGLPLPLGGARALRQLAASAAPMPMLGSHLPQIAPGVAPPRDSLLSMIQPGSYPSFPWPTSRESSSTSPLTPRAFAPRAGPAPAPSSFSPAPWPSTPMWSLPAFAPSFLPDPNPSFSSPTPQDPAASAPPLASSTEPDPDASVPSWITPEMLLSYIRSSPLSLSGSSAGEPPPRCGRPIRGSSRPPGCWGRSSLVGRHREINPPTPRTRRLRPDRWPTG